MSFDTITEQMKSVGRRKVLLGFSFDTNGAASPTVINQGIDKPVTSVARTGVGLLTVTFGKDWQAPTAKLVALSMAAPSDSQAMAKTWTVGTGSGSTLTIETLTAGAAADIAAASGNRIEVMLWFDLATEAP